MNADDRAAIEGLFGRLASVERSAGARDAEAEAFIRDRIAQQPTAPYFMAQTIVVQEQALAAAQARIEALEAEASQRQSDGGGVFGGLFGGSSPARRTPARPAAPTGPLANGGQAQGGGFLAGAAQTAMGVAGGVLLANAIGGMFDGGEAQAAEAAPADDPMAGDQGGDPGAEADGEGDFLGGVLDMFGGDEEF